MNRSEILTIILKLESVLKRFKTIQRTVNNINKEEALTAILRLESILERDNRYQESSEQ